jgi:NADH-quinone oxidoreductase subunit I
VEDDIMNNRGANSNYWNSIREGIWSAAEGFVLTLKHFFSIYKRKQTHAVQHADYFKEQEGLFTVQYPASTIPLPDNGRYRLHNEIDDCIVCDKCAKVCPVNCIDIEPVRATEEIGLTSDGTPKRIYAAKFDIDMGKCCFCGLCTTVCPTECLTMTKAYDFSVFDIKEHNYAFATMTDEEVEDKKQLLEQNQKEKSRLSSNKENLSSPEKTKKPVSVKPKIAGTSGKPVFKPRVKPKPPKKEE